MYSTLPCSAPAVFLCGEKMLYFFQFLQGPGILPSQYGMRILKKQSSRLFLTLSEVFSAFWRLAHSSVLRRCFVGFGLSFSPKVLVPFRYTNVTIFRISPRRQQQNLLTKVLRTSGFFRILRFLLRLHFLYCGRKVLNQEGMVTWMYQ